jgi:hypothetical protein
VRSHLKGANLAALALCVLFVAAGGLFISKPGIEQDEALFAAGIYPPFFRENNVRLFGHEFPLMVMTYVGTLKAMLYRFFVFPFFEPSAASVRIPALLIGAASVWLFYRLALNVVGARGALLGTALLATDTSYMLTIRWDWGPVALQHLCLIAGVLAIIGFSKHHDLRLLAAGFFAFGLGLWDKALFGWTIVALGAATLAVFPRFARALLAPRVALIACLSFFAGALPLLVYNVRNDWITLRSNARWSSDILGYKAGLVWGTLQGETLLGFIPRDEWDGPIREPGSAMEAAVVSITMTTGFVRKSLAGLLLVLALLLIPLAREYCRAIAFALLFSVVLWLQMALTDQGGTGAHHSILLWPAPQFIIAGALAGASKRLRYGHVIAALLVAATCVSNLVVTGTHYTNLIRNGAVNIWSDAIYPAAAAIKLEQLSELCFIDWGFFENFRLLYKGATRLSVLNPGGNPNDVGYARSRLHMNGVLFVGHVAGSEVEPGSLKRFIDFLSHEGYRPSDVRVFNDLNGRPMIQVFRVQPK